VMWICINFISDRFKQGGDSLSLDASAYAGCTDFPYQTMVTPLLNS
jgi:hypothetical protein